MFGLLVRPHLDRSPHEGERFYCEDWQCPQRWRCQHHFARSYAYAAMIQWSDGKDRTPFYTPYRASFEHQCQHYRLDRPRKWLTGFCEPFDQSWRCPGCAMPECPAGSNVVQLSSAAR